MNLCSIPRRISVLARLVLLLVTAAPAIASGELTVVAGFLNNDTTPASGVVGSWGATGSVALDYQRRSVAVDLATTRVIRALRFRDSDATSRLTSGNYTLWASNDNVTYVAVTGWQLTTTTVNSRLIHTFSGPAVMARYLKVNTSYADTAYTFVLSGLQDDIRGSSVVAGFLNSDTNPASAAVTAWGGTGGVAVDYQRRSVALDFSTSQPIRSIKLRDSNTTSRLTAANYTVWRSNDNLAYTPVSTWHLDSAVVDGRLVHTFSGFDITARYIKINTSYTDTAYTFVLSNLQDDLSSFGNTQPDFGVTIHSDGDRMFPPGSTDTGVSATTARDTIISEVSALADAGFKTLKMGIATDVLNWNAVNGSPRSWRLDDPVWQLSSSTWALYADLRGRAYTARNLFNAGIDPILVAAQTAKARGMYFILSYRIADTHFTADPDNYPLTSKFYLNSEASTNPDNWVTISHNGSSPVPGYARFDQLMNFNEVRVRNHRLGVLFEALDRYYQVADGLELDFTRSVGLFPYGDGSTRTSLVTEFIQDVRDKMLELETASHRLYLGLRVPWDQNVGWRQGLDVDQQLRERRVDFVVPSNVMTVPHDMDLRSWVAATRPAHAFDPGVALYSGLSARKPSGWSFPLDYGNPANYVLSASAEDEQVLGATLAFRSMGCDGVELYNFAGLVASASGLTRLDWLATNLAKQANTTALNRVFAITPVYTDPYEARFEYAKRLPAEFRDNGTVWANSWDGALAQQSNNEHGSDLFISGGENRASGEQWFLRLGIRLLPGQSLDLTKLSLRILINGVVLWSNKIYNTPPANLVSPGDPAFPAPTHYITIPIASTFPLNNADSNRIVIRQNAVTGGPYGFGLQEIQLGVFP